MIQNFRKRNLTDYYDFSIIILVLSIPLSVALPNIILSVVLLLAIFLIFKKHSFQFPKIYIPLLVLFLYLALKSIFYQTISGDVKIFIRYLNVSVLLFLFSLMTDKLKLIIAFLIMTLIATLFSAYRILSYFIEYNRLPLANGTEVNKLMVFERPYFGFVIVVSILILTNFLTTKFKKIATILILVFLATVFFISARLSIITIIFLTIIYFAGYSKIKLITKLGIGTAILVLLTGIFTLNTNLKERFNVSKNYEATLQKFKKAEPRFIIWNCAKQMTNENFNVFTGKKSYGEIKTYLHDCYGRMIPDDFQKRSFFQERGYNSHNSFIEFYLIGGVIGLILLIIFFGLSLWKTIKNFSSFGIVMSMFLFFILENVLQRQFGCYIFAIIFTIAFDYSKKKLNKSNEKNFNSRLVR